MKIFSDIENGPENSVEPGKPSKGLAEKYKTYWDESKTLEHYRLQEKWLKYLFKELYPKNTDKDEVFLKVSVLNDFYNAGIYIDIKRVRVSEHILGCLIDKKLEEIDESKGDELECKSVELVHAIAQVKNDNNYYCFATKYCSFYRPEIFPIYDSNVENMLMYFKQEYSFANFEEEDLRKYDHFKKIIKGFMKEFKLNGCSLREVDVYLWLAGKYYRPEKKEGQIVLNPMNQ